MTINKVKANLSYLLVLSNFICLLLILFLGLIDGSLSKEDTKTALSIILPIFAVYTTAIVKFYIQNPYKEVSDTSREVSTVYIFLTFIIPLLFFVVVAGLLLNQTYYNKQTGEDFTLWLGIAETCIAVYIGSFIKSLFEKE